MKFGKKRSAPEPEPIDITQRLSILDLRASARPGAEAGSGVPATAGTSAGAPAPSEADSLPGRVVWKPTIYQPPAPGAAAPADVVAEAVTAPQPVVTAPAPVAPPVAEPAPAYAPPPAMPAHLADAARYEAAAFELPSFVPPPVEPEPPVTWSSDVQAPAEPWTSGEPAAEDLAESSTTYDAVGSHEMTSAELPPFEPQADAGEPTHEPWTTVQPTADHGATPLEPVEPMVEVPAARAAEERLDPVVEAADVDLTDPAPIVPEQVVDLTEAPEHVHATAGSDLLEPVAAERGPDPDDGVIRWSW